MENMNHTDSSNQKQSLHMQWSICRLSVDRFFFLGIYWKKRKRASSELYAEDRCCMIDD